MFEMFRPVVLFAFVAVAYALPFPSVRLQIPTDGRIVGGKDADIKDFPYQVSLRNYGRHFCGGVIHKSNVIITASHCFYDYYYAELTVVAGTSHRNEAGISSKVKKIVMHPDYVDAIFDYDVAILLLEEHFSFGPTIQPIPLAPANGRTIVGSRAYASGWGYLTEEGPLADQLQYVSVMTVNHNSCIEAFKPLDYPVTERMLCAGEDFDGKDACGGDSGGPLVLQNKLIGIVSWGEGCARAIYPGVYADVAVLREWIDENVKILLEQN